MRNDNLSLKVPTSLSMDVLVLDHGAIMTHSNQLADKGDFFSVSREQVSPYVLYVPQNLSSKVSFLCRISMGYFCHASPLSTIRTSIV